jgi:outer membrane protein OmpU
MKKVLLTTTALVMTAGVASAEISMSGTAQASMVATGAANAVVVTGADLNFALSGASDNGLSLSTSIDIGGGSLVDYNDDFELDGQDMTADANPAVTIGYGGYTIVMDNEGVDDAYDDAAANHKDIGISGSMADIAFSVQIDTDDNKASASLGSTIGGIALTYAMSNEAGAAGGNKIGASYAMGDVTLSGSSDDNGTAKTTNKVGLKYAMDSITVSYTLANTAEEGWEDYDVSISYSAGAMSATYATDEEGVNSIVTTYDLGGGTTFFASAKNDANGDNVQQAAGISFTF